MLQYRQPTKTLSLFAVLDVVQRSPTGRARSLLRGCVQDGNITATNARTSRVCELWQSPTTCLTRPPLPSPSSLAQPTPKLVTYTTSCPSKTSILPRPAPPPMVCNPWPRGQPSSLPSLQFVTSYAQTAPQLFPTPLVSQPHSQTPSCIVIPIHRSTPPAAPAASHSQLAHWPPAVVPAGPQAVVPLQLLQEARHHGVEHALHHAAAHAADGGHRQEGAPGGHLGGDLGAARRRRQLHGGRALGATGGHTDAAPVAARSAPSTLMYAVQPPNKGEMSESGRWAGVPHIIADRLVPSQRAAR